MAPKLIEMHVPGLVYDECFDPMATEAPREYGWPKPTVYKVGRGWQFRYEITREQREEMLDVAESFGEAQSYGVDDPSVGRMVLRWVEKERRKVYSVTPA